MKLSTLYTAFKTFFTIVLLISVAAACSNTTSSEDDHEEDIEGFRLKLDGETIVEQLPDQNLTGEIVLVSGQQTDLITLYFLDHDGDEFQPHDDDLTLDFSFSENDIVDFEHSGNVEWSFVLVAESEGTTDMDLFLMHGGHSDFDMLGIPVKVEAAD